jgi:hypothetical protein
MSCLKANDVMSRLARGRVSKGINPLVDCTSSTFVLNRLGNIEYQSGEGMGLERSRKRVPLSFQRGFFRDNFIG